MVNQFTLMTSPMQVTRGGPAHNQVGLSLLEMMIAMAIGLVMVVTIGYAYLGARQSFRTQEALSRMQESMRYGFEFMANDLRLAGSTGGAFDGMSNVLVSAALPASVPAAFISLNPALVGYDGATTPATTPPTVCITANTTACWRQGDSITVTYADNQSEYVVTAHDSGARQFTLTSAAGLNAGDILVAADFVHSAIFQTDGVAGGNVTYAAGGAMQPGNSAASLGTFDTDIDALRLYKLRAVTYYVGRNPAGNSSLYRRILGTSAGNATATSEEVLAGVDNLTLRYGVDVSDPADKAVDHYWTAAQVEAGTDGAHPMPGAANTQALRWQRVLSVQVGMAMISDNGGVSTRGDGRLRKNITHTVTIRNRQWDPTQ